MSSPSDNCEHPSSFFKVIPPGRMFQLSIPKTFRPYLQHIETRKAILRRDNKKWQVKIVGDSMFGEGWENFVRDNGVEDRNFVVFNHLGNLVFDTIVYDTTLNEKEYPNNRDIIAVKKIPERIDTYNTRASAGIGNIVIHCNVETNLGELSTITPRVNHHHSFSGILTKMCRYVLYLPTKFVETNGLRTSRMTIMNDQNQEWKVYLTSYLKMSYRLGKGWSNFSAENGLEEGDRFKFELVQTGRIPKAIFHRLPKAHRIPYFKSIATASRLKDSKMNIPMNVARSNGLVDKHCEMVVIDEKQKHWRMRLSNPEDHVRISGIRPMMLDNGVKEGDEFILEIVDNGDRPVMKFHRVT